MPLVGQLINQRSVPLGPLVLEGNFLKLRRPQQIGTELSHDVLNPTRVPLSLANSQTLGSFFTPRMRRADIEVPNRTVAMGARVRLACYPRRNFYPLISTAPTSKCRFTRFRFRDCSACQPRSKAGICSCAFFCVSIAEKPTFKRLRYSLGGHRPSETTHQTLSPNLWSGLALNSNKGGISRLPEGSHLC